MTNDSRLNFRSTREIRGKLRILNILRPLLVTFLLGSPLFFSVMEGFETQFYIFFMLIVISFVLSGCYTAILKTKKELEAVIYLELTIDLLFETAVIFCTGGIESSFSLCYALTIIAASIFLYKKGAYIISSMACALYIILTNFQFYGILIPLSNPILPQITSNIYLILLKVFTNIVSFNIIAYLSGSLAISFRSKKEELTEKEEDLTRLQAFNQNILENISSGLIVTDLDMKIILANKSAITITNFSNTELEGKSFGSFFPDVNIREILSKINSDNRKSYRWEGNLVCKNRETIYIGMTVSLLRNSSFEAAGTISTFQDLTKLKKMEEEVKRNDRMAAIGELAAGMAHEIRNPLASIRGSVEMLQDELDLKDSNKKLMTIVLEESDRLNKIITDFLIFARPKQPKKAMANLPKTIRDTLSLLEVSLNKNKKINIKTFFSENITDFLFDEDQMKQLLWNLITNSREAMPSGGTIEIALQSINPEKLTNSDLNISDKKMVALSISDQGSGIPKEAMSKIFDPFYTTKNYGSGLGLSIVHRIVKNHGGQIRVENRSPEGITFTVLLRV